MPTPTLAEIVAPGSAEWPIPPLDERIHREGGLSQEEGTSAAVQVPPHPGALHPAPPQQYRPGPAEVRVALAHLLARLTAEQANLEGLASNMDLTAHPRAGEALQALSYFDSHLKNAWRCVGSALAALEW
jgi:hypothetical protein